MSACDGVEEEERHHDEEGAEVGGLQQAGGGAAEAVLTRHGGLALQLLQLPRQLLLRLLGLGDQLAVPVQALQGRLGGINVRTLILIISIA